MERRKEKTDECRLLFTPKSMSIVQIGTQEQTKGKHISNVLTRIVTEIQFKWPNQMCYVVLCVYVCMCVWIMFLTQMDSLQHATANGQNVNTVKMFLRPSRH